MKICVVGAGISGLSVAHYLSDSADNTVTLIEKEPQFGGRANVTDDGEHCTRLFLADYHYLLDLFREIPSGDGTVADSLKRCRRFAAKGDDTWVEIDHIYAFMAKTPHLTWRDKMAIARGNRQAILAAKQAASLSSDRFASVWNWSPGSLYRAMSSARGERISYAFPGPTNTFLTDPWIAFLQSRGVETVTDTPAMRLTIASDGVDVETPYWTRRFDAVAIAAFAPDAYDLLDTSLIPRRLDHRKHTHCRAFTIDLDPREEVLAEGTPRIYAGEGITTVVQPTARRCVTLAAFPRSTETEFILSRVRKQLLLQHEPARIRVRDNLRPSEAVFVGQYVDAADVELRTEGRIVVAGSYVDNSYPLDSAEGACRSAYNALCRLASKHPQLRVRSNLGLPGPSRSNAKPTRPPLNHTNASTAPRLAALLWSLSTRASIMLTPLVADIDFVDASGGVLPHSRPAIYVSNHRSTFDVPAGFRTFAYLNVVPHLVIALKYFERGPLGVMLRAAGALPALRGTEATITAGIDALRSGQSVAIMPEGRIFGAAGEAPAHGRGAAEMSIRTGAPIIPIGAFGSQHVWDGGRPRPLVRRRPRPRVVIVIGPPVWPEGRTVDDLTQYIRVVTTSLEESASAKAGIR